MLLLSVKFVSLISCFKGAMVRPLSETFRGLAVLYLAFGRIVPVSLTEFEGLFLICPIVLFFLPLGDVSA